MKQTAQIDAALDVTRTLMKAGDTLGQQEIAEICGCSRALIHQIEKKALRKIRHQWRARYGLSFDAFSQGGVLDRL